MQKTTEPIEMPFVDQLMWVQGTINHVLDGYQIPMGRRIFEGRHVQVYCNVHIHTRECIAPCSSAADLFSFHMAKIHVRE